MDRTGGKMQAYIEELESEIIDLLDGVRWYEIQEGTGLSEERCKEICDLHQNKIIPKYNNKHGL